MHYNSHLSIKLAGDASASGVGAVISHILPDRTEHSFSICLSYVVPGGAQLCPVGKRGPWSLIFGIKKFHNYLHGRHCCAFWVPQFSSLQD